MGVFVYRAGPGHGPLDLKGVKLRWLHGADQPVFRQREYHPAFGWRIPTKARSSDKEPLPFAPGVIPEGLQVVDMGTYLPLVRGGCSWPYKIKVHEPQNLGRLPETFHEEHKEMFAIKKDGTRNFNALCYSSQATLGPYQYPHVVRNFYKRSVTRR